MRIEFSYTLDDLREALMPEGRRAQPVAPRPSWHWRVAMACALGALCIAIGALAVALPGQIEEERTVASLNYRIDLALMLLPALYVFLLLLLIVWDNWRIRSAAAIAAIRRRPRKVALFGQACAVLTGAFVGAASVIAVYPKFASFEVTRTELLLYQLSPWAVDLALLVIVLALRRQWRVRQQWNSDPAWLRPKVLEFDEERFRSIDLLRRVEFAWTYFFRAHETENLLVLHGENGLHFIPKRSFRDATELAHARAILQNSIAETSFRANPEGFEIVRKGSEHQ